MSHQVFKESRREFLAFSALALLGAVIGVPKMAYAEDNTISGFTPVYRGAITKNEPGKVNVCQRSSGNV